MPRDTQQRLDTLWREIEKLEASVDLYRKFCLDDSALQKQIRLLNWECTKIIYNIEKEIVR